MYTRRPGRWCVRIPGYPPKLWPDAQNPCPRCGYLPGPGTCSCLSVRGMSWTRSLRFCLFSGFSVVLPRFPPPTKQCYRFSKSGVPLSVRERPIVRQAVQVACPPPPSPSETLHHVVVIQTPADGPIPVCLLLTPCPEGLRSLSGRRLPRRSHPFRNPVFLSRFVKDPS